MEKHKEQLDFKSKQYMKEAQLQRRKHKDQIKHAIQDKLRKLPDK